MILNVNLKMIIQLALNHFLNKCENIYLVKNNDKGQPSFV